MGNPSDAAVSRIGRHDPWALRLGTVPDIALTITWKLDYEPFGPLLV
jgi:hypothetical protein